MLLDGPLEDKIHQELTFISGGRRDFPDGLDGKESACNAGDPGSIPGSGRSPEEGNDSPPVFLPGESHGQRSLMGYSL